MTIKDEGRPIHEDARCSCARACSSRATCSSTCSPGSPSRRELDERRRDPDPADLELGPARPDPHHAAGAVRGNLQLSLKEFGDALRASYGGAEGSARASTRARRPRPTRTPPRSTRRCSAPSPATSRTWSATSTSSSRRWTATSRSSRTWSPTCASSPAPSRPRTRRCEQAIARAAAALAAGRPALRQPQRAPSRRARLRARGAAGRRSAAARRSTPRPRSSASSASWSPSPSCAAWSRTCARRPAARQARPRPAPVHGGGAGAVLLLQQRGHPLEQHDGPVRRRRGRATGTVYEETGYGLAGIAGESRSGDANGQYIRVGAGGGTNTIVTPPVPGVNGPGPAAPTVGTTLLRSSGAEPAIESSAKTPVPARRSLREPGAARPAQRRRRPRRRRGRRRRRRHPSRDRCRRELQAVSRRGTPRSTWTARGPSSSSSSGKAAERQRDAAPTRRERPAAFDREATCPSTAKRQLTGGGG